MSDKQYITFCVNKKEYILDKNAVIYALTAENHKTEIHTENGEVYTTRMPLGELESLMGSDFLKVRRNILVRASAIASVTDNVNLKNGDTLKYTIRQKRRIIDRILEITSDPTNKAITDKCTAVPVRVFK